MEKTDITVIGAGIVGLAVSAAVSRKDRSLFIIDRNSSFGMETSSRNSEVVHAGMYYPTGSLKHELCIKGNALTYEICDKASIEYRKTGKYIVATNEEEEKQLNDLLQNGLRNGVPGFRQATSDEIESNEPFIKCSAALFSPTTGIVDSHELMRYFLNKAENNGASVVYNTVIESIELSQNGGYIVEVKENTGEDFSFHSDIVINASGLSSDYIAELAGIDIEKENYLIHYCKGSYFRLNMSSGIRIKSLIYPSIPKNAVSLGIHATPDLGGGIRFGPDAEYIERIQDYDVDESKIDIFHKYIKNYLPDIKIENLYPDTSGIRPKLQGKGEGFRDFVIKEESEKGLPGFINLIGIDSPGLTSAPAIAEMVEKIIYD